MEMGTAVNAVPIFNRTENLRSVLVAAIQEPGSMR